MTRRRLSEREVVAVVAGQLDARKQLDNFGGAVWLPHILCPVCWQPITAEQIPEIERDHDDAIGFGEGRDTLENCRYVHGHCHKQKTAQDKARMAKADRQKGEKTGQRARRKRNGPQIRSRGFRTDLRKRMSGTVERREP